MAKLIYSIENGALCVEESVRDKTLGGSRDAWCFAIPRDPKQEERILSLFGVSDSKGCKKASSNSWEWDRVVIVENVNPYIMKLNWRCVVYFGEDMPIVKSKTVKTCTKHYRLWTGHAYKEPKKETYYYVDVKEPRKLFFFFSCHYDFINGERLVEFNEKEPSPIYNYSNGEQFDYIARLDYTDGQFKKLLAEKVEREKKEREEAERIRREIEERKRTDGYCDICGEPAEYVADPFQSEYGNVVMRWLCRDCFNDCLGDI